VSEENVEIVRRAHTLMNEGNLDAAFRLLHPEVEWVVAKEHPEARTLIGRRELAQYQRDWQQMLPDVRFESDRWVDAGERVVGIGTVSGSGRESGADTRVPLAFVFTVQDDLITRVEEYIDPAEALNTVGLER
jgi:ketosteroid isomerase-like protein